MPLTIPENLRTCLPQPQTPWRMSSDRDQWCIIHDYPFRAYAILDSDAEYAFVLRYFMQSKPPGYSISKITCVINPIHTQEFETELQKMELEALPFLSHSHPEPEQPARERTVQRWAQISNLFRPVVIGNIPLEHTSVIPLWQGSTAEKSLSICNSGFTISEAGHFGNGIYFTDSAHYASMRNPGHLLLAWVSMREPYCVVNDQLPANRQYNAHFIPVASNGLGQYTPCNEVQEPDWDEIVVFQKSQTLTTFWVELAVDMPRAPTNQDIEGDLLKQLLQAKEHNHVEEQVRYIEQIGDLYLQKGEWLKAALILNAAVAICQKHLHNPALEENLFHKLENCECFFLESKGRKTEKQGTLVKYRAQLRQIRQFHFSRNGAASFIMPYLAQGVSKDVLGTIINELWTVPVPLIMSDLTQAYKDLLGTLINDLIGMLGPPPVQWACIGLGSMARDEMCPYSDIECAFLLKKETPQALAYFRNLAHLLQIRMVNLGETEFPVFGPHYPSPIPKGYSLDTGGNTPLGKPGLYELIATPEKLAQFQTPQWMEGDIILVNALNAVCWVAGNKKLVSAYTEAKRKMLHPAEEPFIRRLFKRGEPAPLLPSFRSQLAQKLLEGHLHEFRPELSQNKEDTSAFGIKKELYRPLQSILSSLALYHGIDEANITKSIDALRQKGILNSEGAGNLKEALSSVLTLRFNAHKFYQKEEEFLCHHKADEPIDPTLLYLEDQQIAILEKVYRVLIPLHQCATQFAFDPAQWKNCSFYDEGPLARGMALNKSFRYTDAKEAYQQAVALNPNDVVALLRLGQTEEELAKFDEALRRHLRALALAKQQYGENDPVVAHAYFNIGHVYKHRGDYGKALEYNLIALQIRLQAYGENHPEVAASYNNIGVVCCRLGDKSKSLQFYKKALKIRLELHGEKHSDVAACYVNIGNVYEDLRDKVKALKFLQKALTVLIQVHGEYHPEVAACYNNIGTVYAHLIKDNFKALDCFQKALEVLLQVYGEDHPYVAASYNNIGYVNLDLKNYAQALESFRKALEIQLKVYGENHPDVAGSYHNISVAYKQMGNVAKALEFRNKSLEIRKWV